MVRNHEAASAARCGSFAPQNLCRVLACLVLVCLSATLLWAQSSSTGTIVGQVTDQTGAVVVGANVTLVDVDTKTSRNAATNEAGRYTFSSIPPGTYDIGVSKSGFAQAKVQGQKLDVGSSLTINVALKVGAQTESVTVEASGAQLQTLNATVGTTIRFENMSALPNLGRDASTLMVIQPATTPNGQIAGATADQNTFMLDGGNASQDMDGTGVTYTPSFARNPTSTGTGGVPTGAVPVPVESIEEFKVNTSNQTADFNSSAGGQVQMVTRRGTNTYHGGIYEYYLGSNFGANSWVNGHTPVKDLTTGAVITPFTPLPSTHQNRFGAMFGGPVPLLGNFLGGKTYLFMNYEGRRFPNIQTLERTVPTDLMKAGIIQINTSGSTWVAYNLNPAAKAVVCQSNCPTGVTPGASVTYQPATCGATGVACDPRALGLNPEVAAVWKFMPTANPTRTISAASILPIRRFSAAARSARSSRWAAGHSTQATWSPALRLR